MTKAQQCACVPATMRLLDCSTALGNYALNRFRAAHGFRFATFRGGPVMMAVLDRSPWTEVARNPKNQHLLRMHTSATHYPATG